VPYLVSDSLYSARHEDIDAANPHLKDYHHSFDTNLEEFFPAIPESYLCFSAFPLEAQGEITSSQRFYDRDFDGVDLLMPRDGQKSGTNFHCPDSKSSRSFNESMRSQEV
jgi:hypothetical protein